MRVFRGIFLLLCFCVLITQTAFAAEQVQPLQVGDRGEEVTAVQQKLSEMGYSVGSVDGIYGELTAEAVKTLQKDKKMTVDGAVSPDLYKLLLDRELPISRGASVAVVRRLIQTCFQHIGIPYSFGGSTPRGFDCSGFTRYVFSTVGVSLPRQADEQFTLGRKVSPDRLQLGDLVFFETYDDGASHVGIYIGNGQFISATSSRGIAVAELFGQYWGERFLGARRII